MQGEKMSALGQMVAGIAHEINTPLAYIKGTFEVLLDQLKPVRNLIQGSQQLAQPPQQESAEGKHKDKDAFDAQLRNLQQMSADMADADFVGEMETLLRDGVHGIEQISEIVQNLKNFSRLDRSKITEFSVKERLESTLLLARNLLKNSQVEVKIEYADVPKINCWPSQINQVFLNIITNAAHAFADRPEKNTITLRTMAEGANMVRVEIQDNGSGIPADVLPKIFDPFFTTKKIGQGTGMGLSISYKIIQQHGGRIDVDSEIGMGTIFSILLPIRVKASNQHEEHILLAA